MNLSLEDLCSVMRTSSYMNSVASWPNLWVGMRVNMEKVRKNGLAELYSIDRFKKIRKMKFMDKDFNSEQIEMVLHDIHASPLEIIDLSHINLRHVPAKLLANAVSRLQTVNLFNTDLTTKQCIQVLRVSISSRSLVDVNLGFVNLSGVPADLLARAVSRLQTVNLNSTHLRTEQCVKMLETSLSSRSLVDVNLGDVPSNLPVRTVSHLQTVNLGYTRHLNLTSVNLSEVPADLLSKAVCHLQTVNLRYTALTTEQCIEVLEVSLSSRSLVSINLVYVNLSGVPSDILARAVSRLQTAELSCTNLTTGQCIQVLEASLSSRSLLGISLARVKLREVPHELLANAVSHLQIVNLRSSDLTTEQCIQVLEASLSSRSLVDVILEDVNLNEVSSNLLARAVSRLQTVNLTDTSLTTEQCIQVLEASLSSRSLVNVNLFGVNLSEVPSDLLTRAVFHLQTVYLSGTNLTTKQWIQVWQCDNIIADFQCDRREFYIRCAQAQYCTATPLTTNGGACIPPQFENWLTRNQIAIATILLSRADKKHLIKITQNTY